MGIEIIYDSIHSQITPIFKLLPYSLAAVKPFTNAFNGSIVDGKYVVRLDKYPFFNDRKIAVCDWNSGELSTPKIINFNTLNGYAEDPRCFDYNGRPACLFNDGNRMYVGFIDDETCYPLDPPTKKNLDFDGREKNWSPFMFNEKLHIMYGPGRIIEYDFDKPVNEYITEPPKVDFGKIRGGTQIIKYNNKLYTIFHTVKKERNYVFYLSGILELESEPPFRTLRYSKIPLWKPTFVTYNSMPPAPHRSNPMVVFVTFPSHLEIDENGNAMVLAGNHDYTDAIIEFNIDEVLDNLLERIEKNPERKKLDLGPILNKEPRKIIESKIIKPEKKQLSPDIVSLLEPKNNVLPRPQKKSYYKDINPMKTQQEEIRQTLVEQKKNTSLSQMSKELKNLNIGNSLGGKFSI